MDITPLVQAVQARNADDAFRAGFSLDQWQCLAPFLSRKELRAGQALIRQGDGDRSAYFVERGNLQAFVSGAAPGKQRIAVVRAGDLVGEAGLFAAVRRAQQVEAMTPCAVWQLGVGQLDALSDRAPVIALKLLRAAGAVMALRNQVERTRAPR